LHWNGDARLSHRREAFHGCGYRRQATLAARRPSGRNRSPAPALRHAFRVDHQPLAQARAISGPRAQRNLARRVAEMISRLVFAGLAVVATAAALWLFVTPQTTAALTG